MKPQKALANKSSPASSGCHRPRYALNHSITVGPPQVITANRFTHARTHTHTHKQTCVLQQTPFVFSLQEIGSRVAEWLGNRASNQKVAI